MVNILKKRNTEKIFSNVLQSLKKHKEFDLSLKSSDIDIKKFLSNNLFLRPDKPSFAFTNKICGGTMKTYAIMRFMEVGLLSEFHRARFKTQLQTFGNMFNINNVHLLVSAGDILAKEHIDESFKHCDLQEYSGKGKGYLDGNVKQIQRILSSIYVSEFLCGLSCLHTQKSLFLEKLTNKQIMTYEDIWKKDGLELDTFTKFLGVFCKYFLYTLKNSNFAALDNQKVRKLILGQLKDFDELASYITPEPQFNDINYRDPIPFVIDDAVPLNFESYIQFFVHNYDDDDKLKFILSTTRKLPSPKKPAKKHNNEDLHEEWIQCIRDETDVTKTIKPFTGLLEYLVRSVPQETFMEFIVSQVDEMETLIASATYSKDITDEDNTSENEPTTPSQKQSDTPNTRSKQDKHKQPPTPSTQNQNKKQNKTNTPTKRKATAISNGRPTRQKKKS
jgi:hypothetical protein